MITFITYWPEIEEMKSKVDNAKYYNFSEFPIPKTDIVKEFGMIPYLNSDAMWEETIAYWMNKVHKYHQSPYELRDSPLLEDLVAMCYGKETRLLKQEYDQWNPIYEHVKEKFHGK